MTLHQQHLEEECKQLYARIQLLQSQNMVSMSRTEALLLLSGLLLVTILF